MERKEKMQSEYAIVEDRSWEEWEIDGVLHRVDGPAYIRYENGVIVREEWYLDGELLAKED